MRIKRIETDITIGVTAEIKSALEVATDFLGMTPSQLGRQAILEKLVRDGFLRHPMHTRWENNNAHENPVSAK
jgi:hypothetical protein